MYPFNLDYSYLQDFSLLHILIQGLNCNSRKLCLMFWCKASTRMERESNILCTFDKPHWRSANKVALQTRCLRNANIAGILLFVMHVTNKIHHCTAYSEVVHLIDRLSDIPLNI